MYRKASKSGVALGILLPMGLVCLFAFCSLALALLGGRAYKQIQNEGERSFEASVSAGYLRTKLNQFNHSGNISLRQEGDFEMLVIATEGATGSFETRIYMHEGKLLESFERADSPFVPVGGIQIAKLNRCDFSLDADGLFTADIEGLDGDVRQASFAVAEGGSL